jgi:hypothetical protein
LKNYLIIAEDDMKIKRCRTIGGGREMSGSEHIRGDTRAFKPEDYKNTYDDPAGDVHKVVNPSSIDSAKVNHKQNQDALTPEHKKTVTTHIFCLVLNKLLSNFSKRNYLVNSLSNKMNPHVTAIYSHLLQLRENDFSKDANFTTSLSKNWNAFMDEFYALKQTDPNYRPLHNLIIHINDFPSKDQHSLGYYLTKYAGATWLPQPYLAILRKLNRDYLIKGKTSDLAHFIHIVAQILGEKN